SHADRVAPRRDPRPSSGEAGQSAPAPAGGLGPAIRGGDELPPRLHGADPTEARAGAGTPPLLHHRARDGVPVRAERLSNVSVSPRRSPRGASAPIPAPRARPAHRRPRAPFPAAGSRRDLHGARPRSSNPAAGAAA